MILQKLFPIVDRTISERHNELVSLRRHLHANPELSRHEFETTKTLATRLRALGASVHVRPEGNGLYAEITPAGFDSELQPTVAVRSDIDALPIVENTGLPFASSVEGVMHACGHDMHSTVAFGTAMALSEIRDELPGRVRIFFQHAEEVAPGGAPELIAFGCMRDVVGVVGVHVDPGLQVGTVGLKSGVLTAAADSFEVTVVGKGGHGARPHQCVDPIRVATNIITALYQLPTHRFDARDPVVVTIGHFSGGHSSNVIPETAEFSGTIRTLSNQNREKLIPLLRDLIESRCKMQGARAEVLIRSGPPAIINDKDIVQVLRGVAKEVVGEEGIVNIALPSMGSEDFSCYLDHAPGAMFRLGVANDGPSHYLHSDRFQPDEGALAIGSRIMAKAAIALLEKHK